MDMNDLIKNIPPGMKSEEIFREMRDRLVNVSERDRTGPFTPAATIAVNVIKYAAMDCVETVEKLNRELGTNFPAGDSVVLAGLLAATLAMNEMMSDIDPEMRNKIQLVAAYVKPHVVETVLSLMRTGGKGNFTDHSSGGFSARFTMDDKQ